MKGGYVLLGDNQDGMMDREVVQVLLVEDEEAHAELVCAAFEAQQIEGRVADLVVVSTIKEARAWLETAHPMLVLTDLNLPDGRGIDLIPPPDDAAPYPVMIMTSYGDEQIAVEAIKAGALDYVVKSTETLANLPLIAERALRAWKHLTRRRQAEEALRRSEAKYAAVFHANPHSIVINSMRTGKFIEVNDHFLEVMGLQRDDVIGKGFKSVSFWKDLDQRAEFIAMVNTQGAVQNYEMEFCIRPGLVFTCLVSAECVNLGDELCVVSVIRNISARKRAEEALRENKERFVQLFHSSPDAIFVEDHDGFVLDVNEAACRLHRTTRSQLVGKHIVDLVPPDWQSDVEEQFLLLARGEIESLEGYSWTSDQEAIPVEIRAQPITYDGKPAVLLHARDITRRKRTEEILRKSEEQIRRHNEELEHLVALRTARIQELERQRTEIEKLAATGRMAAGIAHEINNPLASIMSSFELISKTIPTDHPRYDFVCRIEKDLDRVATIIRQMYNLYKPVQEAARTFSVKALLEEVQAVLETYRLQQDVALVLDIEGEEDHVSLPPTSVHQVLVNVIKNAIDVSPAGGTVTVQATTRASWLEVAVIDEGGGIEEAVRSHIFEPFFSTKDIKGMGLGLSIAQSLAVAMGGSIMFETTLGVGTIFHVTLPLQLVPYDRGEHGDGSMTTKEPVARGWPSDNRSL